jgi:hypothetical protein
MNDNLNLPEELKDLFIPEFKMHHSIHAVQVSDTTVMP